MNLYTLSRRATSTTHPSLLNLAILLLFTALQFGEAADYSKKILPETVPPNKAGNLHKKPGQLVTAPALLRFLQLLQNRRILKR